jgi:hypothetical protein
MELGVNYQKRINYLMDEITHLFHAKSYKLPCFIMEMCNNEKVVWFKNEPFNFVHGNETVFVTAKDMYSCNYYEDNISIGSAVYNPYDVFCIYKKQDRLFYSDKNVAFVWGNVILHWNASDDVLKLFVKNRQEEFNIGCDYTPQDGFLKSSYYNGYYSSSHNKEYTDKHYNKEIYLFLSVIHDKFKKYTEE